GSWLARRSMSSSRPIPKCTAPPPEQCSMMQAVLWSAPTAAASDPRPATRLSARRGPRPGARGPAGGRLGLAGHVGLCRGLAGRHGAAELRGSHEQQYVSAGRDPNAVLHGMVRVAGDTFQMGGDDPDAFPDDGRRTSSGSDLASLCIEPTCVTNAQFAAFVK